MILMYHNIGSQAGFNTVSEENLQRQMDWLHAAGYSVRTMDDYVQGLLHSTSKVKQVAITFDDAYQSFQTRALPILQNHRFPAVVYVPTQHVGKSNVWDDGKLLIMDWDDLRNIVQDSLVTIGSHGTHHRHLRTLQAPDIAQETAESKAILEVELNLQVHHFSYPYGQLRDFDDRCQAMVAQAGYRSACSTLWNRTNSSANLFALHRIEIEPQDDVQRFSEKISRPFHPKFFRQRIKNTLYRLGLRR